MSSSQPAAPDTSTAGPAARGLATLLANLENPACWPAPLTVSEREVGGGRDAAVMVLLSDALDVVLTERAGTLRRHAGQVSFPGGGIDPGDADIPGAALRETWEEIALEPSRVTVLGRLPAGRIPTRSATVYAVCGWWEGDVALVPHEAEVAAVHRVPLAHLADPCHRSTWRLSGFDRTGPAFTYDDLYIWGFTAKVLDALLALGGWERPWDPERLVEVPARFRS